jgi:O-antigen ligase
MKTGLFSFFHFRSQSVDPWILASIVPLLLIFSPLGGTGLFLFILGGIWLVFGRHKSARLTDWRVMLPSLALGTYALISFAISVWRDPECIVLMPHYVEILLLPFIPAGLALVRNPVHWLALGAKIALCYFAVLAVVALFTSAERYGFGTNPNIAAYFMMLCGCICRFDPRLTRRVNLAFFYLSLVPVLATGNRTAFVFYGLVFAVDFAMAVGHSSYARTKPLKTIAASLLGLGLTGAVLIQIPVLEKRITYTLSEITGPDAKSAAGSLYIRNVIGDAGVETFLSSPLLGAGLCQSVGNLNGAVKQIDPALQFKFFHNMWIDAVAFFGLAGLGLFLWWCFAIVRAVWPKETLYQNGKKLESDRMAVMCLVLMIFIYGLTGSFLSDDRMMGATLLVFAVLISERQRAQLRAGIRA